MILLPQESIKKIKKSEAFIAIITENFVSDEKCLEECKYAEKLEKPMYAVIKNKEAWKNVKNKFMWRLSLPAEKGFDKKIKEDLYIIRAVKDA